MTDLGELLRAALPPVADGDRARDAWTEIVERLDRGPRFSLIDLGLAAAVAAVLLLFPEWFLVLAYHL